MLIKETSNGYIKGSKYEVNNNMKFNFHLKEESNITQIKRRINKFGFAVENSNKNGKGENIFMFTEVPENQNKVIPNTFEFEITKENPNNKMDYELLLKTMNALLDPATGKLSKNQIASELGTTGAIFRHYISFLKKIGFINNTKHKRYHWLVNTEDYLLRGATEEQYLPFYRTLRETKDFDKTKELLGYFCYCTTLYDINNNHKLFKYTNLDKITKEIEKELKNEVNEFGIGFDFE